MIRRNILANFLGRAWGVIAVYAFVPLYVKFMGIDAYGMVGFYSTLIGVLVFADMGFTATLNREMARLSARGDSAREMRDLTRTYESTYVLVSSLLSLLVWMTAPWIAQHWLRSRVLQPHEIAATIRVMGVAIALQLPSSLYIGGLMGLERQVRANALQIGWGAFRGVGAVLVLWLVSPTILAFSVWQLISNAVYLFFARLSLWQALSATSAQPRPQFRWTVFRNTWRYAAGMSGLAAVSILLMQADKLVVSKMLSLDMLGYYSLAGALASVPLILAGPIGSAVFPRLTGLVALEDRTSLARLYHRTCELVAAATIPAALTIAFFARDVLFAWTGSAGITEHAAPVVSFLILGQLIQALWLVPYYLALAHGTVKLNLQVAIVSLLLLVPLLIVLTSRIGLAGAGVAWLAMNLATLPPYVYFLHRRLLPGASRRWCLQSVAYPLLAALPCVLIGRWLSPGVSQRLWTLCILALVWAAASAAIVLRSFELRLEFRGQLSRAFAHWFPSHLPAQVEQASLRDR
jgi:O-antigen/teichoic acid export membrane protein